MVASLALFSEGVGMSERDLFTTDRLFCPGPTPVPSQVTHAGTISAVYHRSEEFYAVFRRAAERLKPLFGCQENPLILTSSGTGAMEAIVTNLTKVGDEVVVVKGGKFGERWLKLAQTYQLKVAVVDIANGKAPAADELLAAIKSQAQTKAVFFQANETSTGAYYDVEGITRELRKHFQGLICVDAISSLGAHPMRMDDWGVDAVCAGSQKGFGMPPGLAFVALSAKAWSSLSDRPRFYFDLAKERKGQAEGRSAWTTALSLVFALDQALAMIHDAGIERMLKQHALFAAATRAAVKAMGLELFAGSAPSNALTAITVPAGMDGSRIVKRLRQRFGMFFAGGQDELKGKIIRFAHLGFVNRFDVLDGIAALEFVLAEEGFAFDLGSGVKQAMQVMAKERV